MALPGVRQTMQWFFTSVVPLQRFLENNLPNETTFRNLVSSAAFVLNPEDSADIAQTQQGLVLKSTAADILAAIDVKDIGIGGNLALSVSPMQLPVIALTGGTVTVTQNTTTGALLYTFPAYLMSTLGDVTVTSPVTGQTIVYNSGTGKWANVILGYQLINSNLTPVTTRLNLNFATTFSVTDDAADLATTIDIAANVISYSKIQQASTVTLLGNPTGGTHNVEEITLVAPLAFAGTTLEIATNGVTYSLIQQTAAGAVLIGNPTGGAANVSEITLSAELAFSSSVLGLATNGIGYSKLAQTSGNISILGNFSNSAGDINEIGIVGLATLFTTTPSLKQTLQSNTLKTVSAATYTVLLSDFNGVILGFTHTPTGTVAVSMPNPATIPPGVIVRFKDLAGSAATHNITISPYDSETIDGASTLVISANYGKNAVYTDGTNWFTL